MNQRGGHAKFSAEKRYTQGAMKEEVKEAAHNVAESAKDLVEKLETLARAAFGVAEEKARDLAALAEPYVDKTAEKVRDFADQAEAAIDKAKQKQP